ncbi:MAG: hypothetical protein OXT65_06585 [Alphaproteobacteria bacterium]|nr:hypothetical protein [Alphaproteobacteria bacterium]
MAFNYKSTGLPDNRGWEFAAHICHAWVSQSMGRMFGPDRINNFMQNQPVTAAKRIMDHCDDWSESSVTIALLGPAKMTLLEDEKSELMARGLFGDRVVDTLWAMQSSHMARDAEMERDMVRVYMVESLSGMHDQIIGRKKIDKMHHIRWNMLEGYEKNFARIKGQNPALDKIFEDSLKQSRTSLEALDKAAAQNKPKPPQP